MIRSTTSAKGGRLSECLEIQIIHIPFGLAFSKVNQYCLRGRWVSLSQVWQREHAKWLTSGVPWKTMSFNLT